MRRYLLYNIVCILLFTACEHEIPYNDEYQDSKLLVEALACAGEDTFVCCVGRSYFILDDKPTKPEVLEGLSISLEGASGVYTINSDSIDGRQHYMKLSRPVQAGDELKLKVSHPRFGTACAKETLMPEFIPEVYSCKVETSNTDRHIVTLQLPDYSPYYTIVGIAGQLYVTQTIIRAVYDQERNPMGWDTIINSRMFPSLYSYDPIFANTENAYNEQGDYYYPKASGQLFMSSDYPSGKQIELYINTFSNLSDSTSGISNTYQVDSFLLDFEVRSEAYNLYMASMQEYLHATKEDNMEVNWGDMFSSIGLEETVSVYNNIENGFGIFMSKTKTKIRIK